MWKKTILTVFVKEINDLRIIIFFLIWINFYSLIYLKIIFFWQYIFISLISSQSRRFLIKNNTALSEGSPLNNTLYTILEDSSLRPWITLADEIISSSRTISCAPLTNDNLSMIVFTHWIKIRLILLHSF